MSKKKKRKYSKQKRTQPKNWLPLAAAIGGVLLVAVAFLAWRDRQARDGDVDIGGTPSLVVDQEVIDFGEVKYNQVVQASFQITNVGDGVLQFNEVPYIEVVEGC
jgi:hypothetical protein